MIYTISIVLDKRRKKGNGTYPVKLRAFNRQLKKDKRYPLYIDLSEDEYIEVWKNPENKSFRGAKKELEIKLKAIESRANEEAKQMTVFDFDRFENRLFRKSSDKNSVKYYFDTIIKNKMDDNKIGTAESYKYTLNSLAEFIKDKKNVNIEKLTFSLIDVSWLKEYEKFMLDKGKSYTTVAIYTRTLRVVFNVAIENNDISIDIYPFGKNKYKIPRTKKVKKALNSQQLKTLYSAETLNDNEVKCKDFWFFSFACNGMNLKDIALLKYSDFESDKFNYYRAKTLDKSAEKTKITIYLTEFTSYVIEKYGNKKKTGFVFNIVSEKDDNLTEYKKIKNYTRYINDHIKKIAKRIEIPNDISSYWARHSFATNSIRKGVSKEFISEALNHSSMEVTDNYFAGFEDETKKEFANTIMDF
ncbi:tyrosine-type recombinase/integrase [Polaribacter glomeratus]|uniref:Integrase n=1 Tax=Polaribacter glomeratus TaxID=102 RepID=A0A2S7WIT4_9FLAO|nr:site-specific integrase [Polaribacter glomeratus]PQJ77518.1 hypothetical protein BTO16_17010 [Polaribacter glomeratus]TXD66110.1 site-specific integrase [Polaribacter glomeratus]